MLGPCLAGAVGIVGWSKIGILAQTGGGREVSSGTMPARPSIDAAERRRRIGARHHLGANRLGRDVVAVADDLVGIHATDPASVYLGLQARTVGSARDDVADAFYERRSLLRILGMRRTMFAVPVPLAGVIHAAATIDLGAAERRRLLGMIEGAGITVDPERWLSAVEAETVATLASLGEATAADLTKRVPGLREQIPFGAGKTWQGTVGVSTRLLFQLATEGRIIRGRPKGTWLSSLYRWAPMERWVEGGLEQWPAERAHAELVRRWLRAYGPGTRRDVQWWTGWTVARTKAALSAVGVVEVGLEGDQAGYVLPEDVEPTLEPPPWVALLPSLDTTTMAWVERGFYLGDHAPSLFDRNGNAGPTIWVDGRVVGLWAQRPGGEVVTRLLEDVGREAGRAIDNEAAALHAWLGTDRVFPRFPNPTFRALANNDAASTGAPPG